MADEPTDKVKRRVKNPETFRERAIKAAETTDKPSRSKTARTKLRSVLTPIFRPIGRFFAKLFSVQPFKFFAKVAYWISLVIIPRYVRNSWKELKFVTWPNLRQSRQLTFAVIVFAVVFGSTVALVDLGLDKLFKNILLK
jgi:preprotein translocase SecE subunit